MITYREATAEDAGPIARLHSLSWQQNYREIWSDSFLDGPVVENRRQIWQDRLSKPDPDQYIIIAESDEKMVGFGCAYLNEDPFWGTLLDNLHVRQELKGQGIGRILIQSVARWSCQKSSDSGLFLWVLAKNEEAQKFYDRVGGTKHELVSIANPDGSFSDCYRYVWADVTQLL